MSRGRPTPANRGSALPWLVLIGVVVAVVRFGWIGALGCAAAYLLICKIWPVATCGKCQGSGKCFAPLSNRMHRQCPRCDGQGVHVRLGAAIWGIGDD